MFKTQSGSDILAGTLVTLLGLATFAAALRIAEGAGGQLHPRSFPLLLSVLSVLGGAVLIGRGIRERRNGKLVDWPDASGWRNWWVGLGMILVYVALIQPLGLLIATFLLITAMMIYYGQYRWYVAAGTALITDVVIFFMFTRLLGLPLPMGLLAFLR